MSQNPWQELEAVVEAQSPQKVKKTKKSRGEANNDLWAAIMSLDEEKVREALENGANPDARFPSSKSFPLEHVLTKGEVGMADLLVEFGTTRLEHKSLSIHAFEEDQPATLEWVLAKKGAAEFKEYPFNSDYILLDYARKGRIQCFQWLIKNHDRLQISTIQSQGIFKWVTPYLSIMPERVLASTKDLAPWLKTHLTPTVRAINQAWEAGVEQDSVEFLRLLTRNQWFPEVDDLSWPWKATLKGSGRTVKWLLQAPAFEKQFKDAVVADKASTFPILFNRSWVAPEIISILADHHLLPTEGELSSAKYAQFYLHNDYFHNITKASIEMLAKKWPAALRAADRTGQTMFDILLQNSWEKDKILQWKALAEKIMMKKVVDKPLTQKARKEMGLEPVKKAVTKRL